MPEGLQGHLKETEENQYFIQVPEGHQAYMKVSEGHQGHIQVPERLQGHIKVPEGHQGHLQVPEEHQAYRKVGPFIPNNGVSYRFYNERDILTPSDYVFQAEAYRR